MSEYEMAILVSGFEFERELVEYERYEDYGHFEEESD